ncbi:MAG: kynureninase, partial [Flavobacteriales bacterium]
MEFQYTLDCAQSLDNADPLASYRERFLFPQFEGRAVLYFTGNSLGLQPKGVKEAFAQECDDWA